MFYKVGGFGPPYDPDEIIGKTNWNVSMYAVIRRLTLRTSFKRETDIHRDHDNIGTQSFMWSYMSPLRAGIGMVQPYHHHQWVLKQVIWMCHLSSVY